jgi:hypothetical protein
LVSARKVVFTPIKSVTRNRPPGQEWQPIAVAGAQWQFISRTCKAGASFFPPCRFFGADDVLNKSFDRRELIACIEAIVRRSKGSEFTIRTGKLVVNLDARVVTVDDKPLPAREEYGVLETPQSAQAHNAD